MAAAGGGEFLRADILLVLGLASAAVIALPYQAGKLFLLGLNPARLSVVERTFSRCMSLAVSPDGRSLGLATHFQLYRFGNVIEDQAAPDGQVTCVGLAFA